MSFDLGNVSIVGVGISGGLGAALGWLVGGRRGAAILGGLAAGGSVIRQAIDTDTDTVEDVGDAFTAAMGGSSGAAGGYSTAEPPYVATGGGDLASTAVAASGSDSAAPIIDSSAMSSTTLPSSTTEATTPNTR